MKGILYYFSGTGNTKWVADRFKANFQAYNINLDLVSIESVEQINIGDYDFFIIGSPVYAEAAPKLVDNFLNKLLKYKENMRVIVYSTQGAKSAAATSIMAKKLENAGFKVIVQSNIKMTNNYYFAVGKELKANEQKEALYKAEEKIKILTKCFIENKIVREGSSLPRILLGKVSSKIFTNMLPRISKDITSTDKCIKCGLCLRNCPKGNITFENSHAIFHSKCMLCLRCIYICPKNAIMYKGKNINQIQKEIINCLNLSK